MQLDIFNYLYPTYKITKPIRLIELFAGYGSQALALKYLGVEFEHYRIVEFDKYAIQSYNEIHNTDFEVSDITETKAEDLKIVDTDKYEYIMTYSFPCQDLSLAGKRAGMENTSTRSGLLWEVERILYECKELPQVLLMENVPQVIGSANIEHFNKWQFKLESLGYKNYHQNLIATDYGIPQTRNRTFMISILGDYNYNFPQPIPLKLKLKDLLEDEVDERYYLSDKMINFFRSNERKQQEKGNGFKWNVSDGNTIEKTITTRAGSRMDDNFIVDNLTKDTENYIEWQEKGKLDIACRAWKDEKVVSTLHTKAGEIKILENSIAIPEATKKGYAEAKDGDGVYINRPHQKRGCVQKEKIQTLKTTVDDIGVVVKDNLKAELCNRLIQEEKVKEYDVIKHSYTGQIIDGNKKCVENNNMMPTITTRGDCLGVVVKGNYSPSGHNASRIIDPVGIAPTVMENHGTITAVETNLRIRKLTPKECFRLMGVKDEDYEKLTCSNAQKYKQAGNSIVVNVLMAIFKELI